MSNASESPESSPPSTSIVGDILGCFLTSVCLIAVLWIITAFSIVPLQLSIRVSPWLGMLVATCCC